MKELHCMLCDAFWYADEENQKEYKYCPFCAAELCKQDSIVIDSFEKALLKVICFAGIEILKNKKRLIAYLSDMAPEYGKEIRIFSKSCNNSLLNMFYEDSQIKNADENTAARRQRKAGMAKQILRDKEGLSEIWIDTIVNALVYALEWEKEPVCEVINVEREKDLVSAFQLKNKQNNLKEDLDRYESSIISAKNKRSILLENVDEAKKEYEKQTYQLNAASAELYKIDEQYRAAVAKTAKWKQVWKNWENELEELKNKRRKCIDVPSVFTSQWSKDVFSILQQDREIYIKRIKKREDSMKKYYPEYIKAGEIETKLYNRLCEQKSIIISLEQSLKDATKQLQKADQEFAEYDQQYQSIQAEIERIQQEITLLDEEKKHS